MLRSMDSAVAGLRAHQNKMDVIGHNIANVNTFGFKAQTYTFKEAMYQTSSASTGGTAGTNGSAGANVAQYGYGALMGTIGMDMTASTPTYVGGFNASISGDGFFVVKSMKTTANPGTEMKTKEFMFTRVGQFSLDSNGYVVDGDKNFVYGFYPKKDGTGYRTDTLVPLRMPLDDEIAGLKGTGTDVNPDFDASKNPDASSSIAANHPLISKNVSINSAGDITVSVEYTDNGKTETKTISLGAVAVCTFQNPNGVTKAGGNYYTTNKNDNAGNATAGIPDGSVNPGLMTGYVEASNVDLAKEFADMITTHRGYQSNTKMITVSDEMLSDLVAMKR